LVFAQTKRIEFAECNDKSINEDIIEFFYLFVYCVFAIALFIRIFAYCRFIINSQINITLYLDRSVRLRKIFANVVEKISFVDDN